LTEFCECVQRELHYSGLLATPQYLITLKLSEFYKQLSSLIPFLKILQLKVWKFI